MTRKEKGKALEEAAARWISELYPHKFMRRNIKLGVVLPTGLPPAIGSPVVDKFECDIVLFHSKEDADAGVNPFLIVECKNFKNELPHHYISELFYRVKNFGVEKGVMVITGPVSPRTVRVANSTGIDIYCHNLVSNTFKLLNGQ